MDIKEFEDRLQEGRQMEHSGGDVASVRAKGAPESDLDSFNLVEEMRDTTWEAANGTGWNLIALPFRDTSAPFNYRVLLNQYNETLKFKLADVNIPNRGITPDGNDVTDQLIDGLDYEQVITQVAAEDSPASTLRVPDGNGIHHEPGFFLQILNHQFEDNGDKLEFARLATIPHGNSVLAMGKVEILQGPPIIPDLNALPIRVSQDIENNPYLGPYKHFEDNKFFGTVPADLPEFPGFFSTNANAILQFANRRLNVTRTVELHFDSKFQSGGIVNTPFTVREADATEMKATFWIMDTVPEGGGPVQRIMQYSQTVFLDFFPSRDDPSLLIRWPHVSINTLRQV